MRNVLLIAMFLLGLVIAAGCKSADAGELKPVQKDGPVQKSPVQKSEVQKCEKKCCCDCKCMIVCDTKCKRVYETPCGKRFCIQKSFGWRIRAVRMIRVNCCK